MANQEIGNALLHTGDSKRKVVWETRRLGGAKTIISTGGSRGDAARSQCTAITAIMERISKNCGSDRLTSKSSAAQRGGIFSEKTKNSDMVNKMCLAQACPQESLRPGSPDYFFAPAEFSSALMYGSHYTPARGCGVEATCLQDSMLESPI